jgi:hypothetical protein
MKKNKGRPPARWVDELADGEYTVQDLIEITGKSALAIRWIMRKYAKSARYVANNKVKGIIAYYLWNREHYIDKLKSAAKARKLLIDATRGTK